MVYFTVFRTKMRPFNKKRLEYIVVIARMIRLTFHVCDFFSTSNKQQHILGIFMHSIKLRHH